MTGCQDCANGYYPQKAAGAAISIYGSSTHLFPFFFGNKNLCPLSFNSFIIARPAKSIMFSLSCKPINAFNSLCTFLVIRMLLVSVMRQIYKATLQLSKNILHKWLCDQLFLVQILVCLFIV